MKAFVPQAAASICVSIVSVSMGADVCITNPGNGPDICVQWQESPDPVHTTDFEVDFTDAANPDIDLKKGSLTWEVWAAEGEAQADPNIGTITTTDSENYKVKIASGTDPGALNVAALSFQPSGDHHSSIAEGSSIAGNLGDLTVVADSSGDGGAVSMVIGGSVSGDIVAAVIPQYGLLNIVEDLESTGSIEIGKIDDAGELNIDGDANGNVTITGEIYHGTLRIEGSVGSTVTIEVEDMTDTYSGVFLGAASGTEMSGELLLKNGIPHSTARAHVYGGFTGSINLNEKDLLGTLYLHHGGSGDIEKVSNVTSSADVNLASDSAADPFSGDATLADVAGSIATSSGKNLSGDIQATGDVSGDISIGGSLESTGRIIVNGKLTGLISVADETQNLSLIHVIEGIDDTGGILVNADSGNYDANGRINIGPAVAPDPLNNVTFDGCIQIQDDGSGNGGDLEGTIRVVGCHATADDLSICIVGDENGTIEIVQTECTYQVVDSCSAGTCL